MGEVIDDFRQSSAPQFKGKSDKKIRQMAIAAKLNTESADTGVEPSPQELMLQRKASMTRKQIERERVKSINTARQNAAKSDKQEQVEFSGNYEGPLYAQHPDLVEARRGPAAPGKKEKGEKASKSLADMRNRQKVLDTYEKKTGKKLDISKTPEGKAHAKNFPGSRQARKKKGAKETPAETQNRRIMNSNQRIIKHGYTSKEKKEVDSMAKHASRYD